MTMKNWRSTAIPPQASIRDAIRTIESGALQIALVVDAEERLLGTVTDGDIRRGMLRGISLESPVGLVMNPRPRTVTSDTPRAQVRALMAEFSIHQVPVLTEGRVVGLQLIDEFIGSPQTTDTLVVLMAGGLGTRLKPITEAIPKPMIPVGGRPIIENIIGGFRAQGFRRFLLSVNYKAEILQEHFGDGRKFGVSIEYVHEKERRGTAGALALMPERPSSPFIVMNGDLLTTVDFRQLLDFHRAHEAAGTMCVREHTLQIPYGVVETKEHRLVSLTEKPVQTFFVNAGIYALSPEALDVIPRDRLYDMTELFTDLLASGSETVVFPMREYWLDVGRLEDLERATLEFPQVFG